MKLRSKFVETPWILLCVCVAGVILAAITEEGNSNVLISDLSETIKFTRQVSQLQELNLKLYRHLSYIINYIKTISNHLQKLVTVNQNPNKFSMLLKQGFAKVNKTFLLLSLKRTATTKRHLFYLIQKRTMNLDINPSESEMTTYLDCKEAMGEKWPFMWEVSDVKNEKITCQNTSCYPLSSYSYLNLIRDQRVQDAAITSAKFWSTGNHGPRMLGGNMSILVALEKCISQFFSRDSTLLCASGYLACMSICAALATENTIIFADSRLHASLRTGLSIGSAKIFWFKHNNFCHCEDLIKRKRRSRKEAWMIVESVYSMDGDICNLPKAYNLCNKYNVKLLIDEAHGLGILGKSGRGVEEHYQMQGCATIIAGTFSKSIASIGGFITGPKDIISYLDFHALGNVFSAPLPAYCAGAALKSFEIIDSEPELISRAQENSKILRRYLKTGLNLWPKDYAENKKYEVGGDECTTVIPLIFRNDIDRVMRIASKLYKKGFMISAVAYPACPLDSPRFRITATAALDQNIMRDFVTELVTVCIEEGPSQSVSMFL